MIEIQENKKKLKVLVQNFVKVGMTLPIVVVVRRGLICDKKKNNIFFFNNLGRKLISIFW